MRATTRLCEKIHKYVTSCATAQRDLSTVTSQSIHTAPSLSFWIESDIYYQKLNPSSSLKDEMRSFDHTQKLTEKVIPCCDTEKVPPWVLTHLFYVHRIKLPVARCDELLRWTHSQLEEAIYRMEVEETPALREVRKKMSYMYSALLSYHHVNSMIIGLIIDIMVLLEQYHAIEWIFKRVMLSNNEPRKANQRNFTDSLNVLRRILQAIRSLKPGFFSDIFINGVVEKISSNEVFLSDSVVVCSLVVIFHEMGDTITAEDWLQWHFRNIGYDVDDSDVWKIFPSYDWLNILTPCHPARIDWTRCPDTIRALVEGHLYIDATRESKRTVQRAVSRLCDLSTVSKPILHDLVKVLECAKLRFGESPVQKDDTRLPSQHFAFLKILCDRRDYVNALGYLNATQEEGLYPESYAEVLVLEKCTDTIRTYCFRKIRDLAEISDRKLVYRCYDRIVRRYMEHRGVDIVGGLRFLDDLIRRYHTDVAEHKGQAKGINCSKDSEEGMHSSTLIDEFFPDIIYDRMDNFFTSAKVEALFRYITEHHPRLDEVLVQTILQSAQSSYFLLNAYSIEPASLLSSLHDVPLRFGGYDHVYVLDASAVECFESMEAFLADAASKKILLLVPFVSLREACLTMMVSKNPSEDVEASQKLLLSSIRKLLMCLSAGVFKRESVDSPSTCASSTHARLLHPTEELLLRQLRWVCDLIDENSLGKNTSTVSAKSNMSQCSFLDERQPICDDDDRVLFATEALGYLLEPPQSEEKVHSAPKVQVLTLDEKLMRKARRARIQATQLTADLKIDASSHGDTSHQAQFEQFSFFNETRAKESSFTEPQRSHRVHPSIRGDVTTYYNARSGAWRDQHNLRKKVGYIPAWKIDVQKINVRDSTNKPYLMSYLESKSQGGYREDMKAFEIRENE